MALTRSELKEVRETVALAVIYLKSAEMRLSKADPGDEYELQRRLDNIRVDLEGYRDLLRGVGASLLS